MLACLASLSPVQAALSMNFGGDYLYTVPETVNADSNFPIVALVGDQPFSAGDCFEIEFGSVDGYEAVEPGHYVPIPASEITICTLVPASLCEKKSDFMIKFTLTEDQDPDTWQDGINGDIG
jgi:hypothetical protein